MLYIKSACTRGFFQKVIFGDSLNLCRKCARLISRPTSTCTRAPALDWARFATTVRARSLSVALVLALVARRVHRARSANLQSAV